MSRELIEKPDKVVVVDEDSTVYEIPVQEEMLVINESIPQEIASYVSTKTDYREKPKQTVDWPLKVTTGHHLEGTVGIETSRTLNDILDSSEQASEIFENEIGGRIDYPSIEIIENWEVSENGSAELTSVEYAGVKYTPK